MACSSGMAMNIWDGNDDSPLVFRLLMLGGGSGHMRVRGWVS
jgi:hypothetical protein